MHDMFPTPTCGGVYGKKEKEKYFLPIKLLLIIFLSNKINSSQIRDIMILISKPMPTYVMHQCLLLTLIFKQDGSQPNILSGRN